MSQFQSPIKVIQNERGKWLVIGSDGRELREFATQKEAEKCAKECRAYRRERMASLKSQDKPIRW